MEIFVYDVLLSEVDDATEVSSSRLTRCITFIEASVVAVFFRGVVVLDDAALRQRPLCKAAYDGDDDRLVCNADVGRCCLCICFSS